MKLIYLSFARLPGRGTHTINIIRTCAAIENEDDMNVKLVMRPNRATGRKTIKELEEYYGVQINFNLSFLAYFCGGDGILSKWTAKILMGLRMVRLLMMQKSPFAVYSRQLVLIRWIEKISRIIPNPRFLGTFCEIHSLPERNKDFSGTKGIIAISSRLKNDLIALHPSSIADDNSLVAHSGACSRENYLTLQPDRHADSTSGHGKFILLYTGRIIAGKGVDVLIDAFHRIADKHRELDLLLVGKVYGDMFQEKAGKLIDQGRIVFAGYRPPSEVNLIQERAACCIMPTGHELVYSEYTSPIKLFEYMMAGKPVIASDLDSVKEIITHGHNGFLFKTGDHKDLARKIEFVIDHPQEAKVVAARAAEDAKQYTWEARGRKIAAFIRERIEHSSIISLS